MKYLIASILLLIGLVQFSPAAAQKRFQPGYLVVERGDTLRGMVAAPTRNTVTSGVTFKKNTPPATELFYPLKTLRSLGLADGKTYEVHKMQPVMGHDTLRLLLEVLAKGRVNLYRSSYNAFSNQAGDTFANQLTFSYFYVTRPAEPTRIPYLLQSSTFRADLRSLFSDCPTAPAVKGQFEEANILRLVQQYNACSTSLAP